jgi:signal peptidase I
MESSAAVLNDRIALVAPAAEQAAAPVRPGLLRRIGWPRIAVALFVVAVAGTLGYLRAFPPVATVMSGSMAPTIETGDVVVMKRIDGAPKVGDVVAVTVPDDARSRYGYPTEVIHRIVEIAPDGRVTTKGDARKQADPFTVAKESIHAKVVTSLPAAGRALAFLTSTLGLVWLGLGALLLVVMPLIDRQRDLHDREQEGLQELSVDVQVVLEEVVQLRAALEAMRAGSARVEALPVPEPVDPAPVAVDPEPEPVAVDPEPEPVAVDPEPLAPVVVKRRSGGLVGRARDWLDPSR